MTVGGSCRVITPSPAQRAVITLRMTVGEIVVATHLLARARQSLARADDALLLRLHAHVRIAPAGRAATRRRRSANHPYHSVSAGPPRAERMAGRTVAGRAVAVAVS